MIQLLTPLIEGNTSGGLLKSLIKILIPTWDQIGVLRLNEKLKPLVPLARAIVRAHTNQIIF
jgi:hypothetical protein